MHDPQGDRYLICTERSETLNGGSNRYQPNQIWWCFILDAPELDFRRDLSITPPPYYSQTYLTA